MLYVDYTHIYIYIGALRHSGGNTHLRWSWGSTASIGAGSCGATPGNLHIDDFLSNVTVNVMAGGVEVAEAAQAESVAVVAVAEAAAATATALANTTETPTATTVANLQEALLELELEVEATVTAAEAVRASVEESVATIRRALLTLGTARSV